MSLRASEDRPSVYNNTQKHFGALALHSSTPLIFIMILKIFFITSLVRRLELIDDAMLRPGRLGKLLYVPLPTAPDRISILAALIR